MNPVLIQSWYFFKNNAKEMCAFMLPVFALGMIAGVIGVINPQSGILNILNLIQIIIGPLFTGGLLFLIANISRGDHPPHQEMLKQAVPFWLTIFIVSMLTGLAIGLGFIFMIIPGIWLLLRLFLAPLYVVFQNKTAPDAIATSFSDSKDHLLQFFQILIPFILLGAAFFMMVVGQGPVEGESGGPSFLSTTLVNLATTFAFIFASIVQFRMYTVYIENQNDDEDDEELAEER
jgi:hypothetical protein